MIYNNKSYKYYGNKRTRTENFMKKIKGVDRPKRKEVLIAFTGTVFASLFPCIFLYFKNIGKLTVLETNRSVLTLLGFGLLTFFIFWAVLKNVSKAAIFTAVAMSLMTNFTVIENAILRVFPSLFYWHVVIIVLFVLFIVAEIINLSIKENIAFDLSKGILLIFSLLILVNILMASPKIIQVIREKRSSVDETIQLTPVVESIQSNQKMPNFYFFIFDEYGGYENLQRYTGFDNIDFVNDLKALKFNVSLDSRNPTIDTFTEIPNLLQLERVNSVEMTANAKKENIKNPKLLILLKQLGYKINVLEPSEYPFVDQEYADYHYESNLTTSFRSFDSYIIGRTIYYPFFAQNDQDDEIRQMEAMFSYAAEAVKLDSNNLFTIGYFVFPHVPYIVDQNGNKTSSVTRMDLKNPSAYLNQLKYASVKILELVSTIVKNQPDAYIVLQSDHGYRYPSHLDFWYGEKTYDLELESIYERNILNAVYLGGDSADISGLDGISTLKIVMDRITSK